VGVCARDKKAFSKPMAQILSRFDPSVFDVLFFGDEVILTQPIEKWPVVDCLMSWYSAGFPLAKAEAYVRLRGPFSINDLGCEHADLGVVRRAALELRIVERSARLAEVTEGHQVHAVTGRADLTIDLVAALQLRLIEGAERPLEAEPPRARMLGTAPGRAPSPAARARGAPGGP
jgi:hypothetical protein